MKKARILIVEDEDYLIELLKASLEELGYTVIGNSNTGKGSIVLANKLRPDVVLMDVQLKGEMDGIQAAEIIQNYLYIPIIFLTAHDDDDKLDRAKLSLPFGYLLKPFRARELKIAIEMAIYRQSCETARREKTQMLSKKCQELIQHLESIHTTCQKLILDELLIESHKQQVWNIHENCDFLKLAIHDLSQQIIGKK